MKTEREIFDEWYKSEYPLDYEHYVNEQDIGLFTKLYWRCFVSWKASASREGYKFVPVEPSADLVNHGHQVFLGHFNEGGQTGGRSLYFAYKAMIEAQENKG